MILQTLESCVKNCGSIIHEEIATKEFMEFLKDIAKVLSVGTCIRNLMFNEMLSLFNIFCFIFPSEQA